MKRIILVKSSLCEVRFNPREITLFEVMSHQCDYSLFDVFSFGSRLSGETPSSAESLHFSFDHILNFYLLIIVAHCLLTNDHARVLPALEDSETAPITDIAS